MKKSNRRVCNIDLILVTCTFIFISKETILLKRKENSTILVLQYKISILYAITTTNYPLKKSEYSNKGKQ